MNKCSLILVASGILVFSVRAEIPEKRLQLEIPIISTDLNNDGLYERIIYSYYIPYTGIGTKRYLTDFDLDSDTSFWDLYQGGPITLLPNDYELIPNKAVAVRYTLRVPLAAHR